MGVILDPTRAFVGIDVYFVEEEKKHGNTVLHFIKSRSDFEEWRGKGYRTQEEIVSLSQAEIPEGSTPPSLDAKKIIQKVNTQWKRMSWKDQNTILSRSLKNVQSADGKVTSEIDTIIYRDNKLKTCLKKWDIKGENGDLIECNESTIDMLDPRFAQYLLDEFEKVTEASGDDLKN